MEAASLPAHSSSACGEQDEIGAYGGDDVPAVLDLDGVESVYCIDTC
jgi:hypothetical protein